MSNTDTSLYLQRCEALFARVEALVDRDYADCDSQRNGSVLTIDCAPGAQIIINRQEFVQEVWLASKLGARHFRWADATEQWLDTRDGAELMAVVMEHLQRLVPAQ